MLRTRVTVLSGFLGAGKTTLLNALLRDTTEPLGVIVNDFGSVNIDASLIAGQASVQGEVALQNGCICCTIRGDLLTALLSLIRRRNAPRHILIEASGISDPASIVRTFTDPRIADLLELSAVVGCVDPGEFANLVGEDWTLASSQLRACDFIVSTKSDISTRDQQTATAELIRNVAPRARVVSSSLTQPPTALLLSAQGLWDGSRIASAGSDARQPHVHEVGHDHGHHHHHGHAFETWTYRTEHPLSAHALRSVLAELSTDIYRAKGFVHIADASDTRVLVQVVGRRAELRADGTWDGALPSTELVFLAHEGTLSAHSLRASLDACAHDGRPLSERFMEETLGHFNRLLSGVPKHVDEGSSSIR